MIFRLSTSEKIRIILGRLNISISELADLIGMSQPNLSKKLKNNSLSVDDLRKISEALGIELEINFILKNGDKI